MRRKSIGATSQAFHEPMSTRAFLEFLTGMQGSGACWPVFRGLGPGPAAEMLERRRNPASHGTVQLRLRKPSKAPQGQRTGGYGSVLRPGHGFETQQRVSRGLGARAPRAWGPAHQGPGAFSPQKPPTSQITIFSQTSWWEPGEGVGVG